jgi:Na+-driven multidrug efflux pump
MAAFGPEAVAGEAMIDRISPVAFGLIYALTGAVGPIIAQNLGAGRFDRVREALRDSLLVVVATVMAAWAILAATAPLIVFVLSAEGLSAMLLRLFCHWLAGAFLFSGALYVANAAFNNLSHPFYATLFNWARASLGTLPFVAYGAAFGPQGVLFGQAAGSFIFGVGAVGVAFHLTGRPERIGLATTNTRRPGSVPPVSGHSGKAALAAILSLSDQHNR